jgi:hypothetical protein
LSDPSDCRGSSGSCPQNTPPANAAARARSPRPARFTPAAYHVLDRGVPYHELGEEFFYRRDTEHTERYQRRLIRQLERLGHQVTLTPLPEAA